MAEAYDVAIVGGGPAGQAAALALDGLGLRIAVIDEQQRPGGQILRQPPRAFTVAGPDKGNDPDLVAQLRKFEAAGALSWLGGQSVISIARDGDAGFVLHTASETGAGRFAARYVLVAAGCQDLAVPMPGWTLPGVYAAGGLQALLKAQRVVPDGPVVLAGTHPLQLLIAAQIVAAGGQVAAVLFAQSRAAMAAPLLSRPLATFAAQAKLWPAAGALRTLDRHKVPVRYGAPIARIHGTDRVEGIAFAGGDMACDAVGLCFGFVPQSALPRMLGAATRPALPAGGFATECDEWMRSSVAGLSVAGETTGVAGGQAAAAGGAIAGIGIAAQLGAITWAEAEARAARPRRRHAATLQFAALLDRVADPRHFLPDLTGDTLVCRCEDVALDDLRPALDGRSANAVKLATRCGMGVCQGRNCEPTLLRLIGDAREPGFTSRFPARPVRIGDLTG